MLSAGPSTGPPFCEHRTAPFRSRLRALSLVCACAAALLLLAPLPASAQGGLEAHYEATLAGIPVGKGAWTIDIGDDMFSAAAHGGTAGLLKAFAGGTGTGASQGRVVNGALVATNYTATTTTSKKSETIRIALRTAMSGNSPSSRSRRSMPTASRSPTRTSRASSIR